MIYLRSYLLVVLMLLWLAGITLRAQNIPDSLHQKLSTSPNDSAKAITLLEIGESIEGASPEKSIGYYRQAVWGQEKNAGDSIIVY